jgi:alkylated DNA repair dioxygenase AlkB
MHPKQSAARKSQLQEITQTSPFKIPDSNGFCSATAFASRTFLRYARVSMSDLFSAAQQFQRIPIPDGEVYYLPALELSGSPDSILRQLVADTPWRQENVVVWAKEFRQPRLTAWYGDPGCDYSYSGITLAPIPWNELLLDVKRRVEDAAAAAFNSVLVNYYRDNRDSMGFHSDDEPELGARPVIASLSLGEERTLVLKHKTNKFAKPVRLRLASGSLLLMKGETQRHWKHGIAKESRRCGPRVNLTFRRIDATSSLTRRRG